MTDIRILAAAIVVLAGVLGSNLKPHADVAKNQLAAFNACEEF